MTIETVRSNHLSSEHLGKFVCVLSTHLRERTLCIGRLIAVDHVLDDRETAQHLSIAISEHEVVHYKARFGEVDVADEPIDLLLHVADKARSEK